jgi:hypothetical protein
MLGIYYTINEYQNLGVNKKTEIRSNPQNPKNKIKILAVYNGSYGLAG